jgi:hypothetical protein
MPPSKKNMAVYMKLHLPKGVEHNMEHRRPSPSPSTPFAHESTKNADHIAKKGDYDN